MKQTYIAKVYDRDGNYVDFERWQYKRTSTIEEKMRELLRHCPWETRWHTCKVFATPNGYDYPADALPAHEFTF